MPCHHNLAAYLDDWIETANIVSDKKGLLFRAIRKGNKLTENPMAREDVLAMIKRAPPAPPTLLYLLLYISRDWHHDLTAERWDAFSTLSRSQRTERNAGASVVVFVGAAIVGRALAGAVAAAAVASLAAAPLTVTVVHHLRRDRLPICALGTPLLPRLVDKLRATNLMVSYITRQYGQ